MKEIKKYEDEYRIFVVERQAELMDQINDIMESARKDVGLIGDTGKLIQQSKDMTTRARISLAEFLKRKYCSARVKKFRVRHQCGQKHEGLPA